MVTLKQLVDRAFEQNNQTGKFELDRETIEPIVLATVHGLGFHLAEGSGEVCDPRPKPVATFPNNVQHQTGVRWRGGRRR